MNSTCGQAPDGMLRSSAATLRCTDRRITAPAYAYMFVLNITYTAWVLLCRWLAALHTDLRKGMLDGWGAGLLGCKLETLCATVSVVCKTTPRDGPQHSNTASTIL